MTLRELKYFIAVYQEKSITKAAEKLFVAPSNVSTAIKNLENEFNIILFVRSANRITRTLASEQFYKHALNILNDISLLENDMRSFHRTLPAQRPRCRIGISATLLFICGEELDQALSQAFPDYLFFIESYSSIDEPDFYKKYDITIALTYLGISFSDLCHKDANFTATHFRSVQPYIWISKFSPLCIHDEVSYKMLETYNFISYKGFINFSYHPEFYITEDRFWEVNLKNQLITSLENFPCFTSDLPLKHGELVFQDLFARHPIKAIKLQGTSGIEIIYKRDYTQNFIALISATFNNLFS